MKYKTGLMKKVQEDKEFAQSQQIIKNRHNIEDENVVVVEKNNMFKFLVRLFLRIIKFAAAAAILLLAAIGLTALIYPAPRSDVYEVIDGVISSVMQMIM